MYNSDRSAPSEFSMWMRDNLLASWEGLVTQDIDVMMFDNSLSSFILIEEKNSPRASVTIPQAVCFKMLDEFLKLQKKCRYYGSYLIYYLNDTNIFINPYELDRDKNTPINKEELEKLICGNFEVLEQNYGRDWFSPIINNHIDSLWDCRDNPPSYKTRKERSKWRGSKIVNICDHNRTKPIDWIFINYCTGCFILIEEKRNSNGNYKPNPNESQLINKVNEIFEDASNKNQSLSDNQKVKNPKSNIPYKYLGYFLLEFGGNGPEDSENIYLNHKKIEKNELKAFLNLNNEQQLEAIKENYAEQWW